MYSPEIIIYMVLKYVEMSSSGQISVHENCCWSMRVVRFTEGIHGLVMKMYTLITPFGLFCSASLCIIISHLVCLICRSQIKQTPTKDYTTMKLSLEDKR